MHVDDQYDARDASRQSGQEKTTYQQGINDVADWLASGGRGVLADLIRATFSHPTKQPRLMRLFYCEFAHDHLMRGPIVAENDRAAAAWVRARYGMKRLPTRTCITEVTEEEVERDALTGRLHKFV